MGTEVLHDADVDVFERCGTQRKAQAELEFEPLFSELTEVVCGTGDRFETGKPSVACDVIDMEAYALAKVCHLEGAPFGAIKFVTDGADGSAGLDWHANLPRAARAFVEHYTRLSR